MNMWKLMICLPFLLTCFCSATDTTISCPVNFSYVETYPWSTSPCHNPYSGNCCQALLAVITMGLAQHLKETSTFLLPNATYSISCLLTLHAKLANLSLQPSLVPHCFQDPTQFVAQPWRCAGILTIQDWTRKVGAFSSLETSCKKDLTDTRRCSSCFTAALMVTDQLMHFTQNMNASKCFYFVILYAAGIVSESGPMDTSVVPCLFGLSTASKNSSNHTTRNFMSILAFGIVGGFVFVLVAFGLSMLFKKWTNRKIRL